MIDYYDVLFSDLNGTDMYFDFIKTHFNKETLIEFASGTGDLLNLLDQKYQVLGVDIDHKMNQKAIEKYPHLKNKIKEGNFLNYKSNKKVDCVICVGDSLNYIHDALELEQFVENTVTLSDLVIVDCHHLHRLNEFQEGYFEEGTTQDFDYNYIIEVQDSYLVHTINFLDGTYDSVVQWVFDPEILIKLFEDKGYSAKVYTDFTYDGILETGEKVFCVFEKETT